MVSIDEWPEEIVVGFAVILTVGAAGGTTTETVTLLDVFPPAPVATAV
jgi:hypothetical protein